MKVYIPEWRGEARFFFRRTPTRVTSAHCIAPDGHEYVALTRCGPTDQYVKALGRRKALTRLISYLREQEGLTYETRREVWLRYFSRHSDLGGFAAAATAVGVAR